MKVQKRTILFDFLILKGTWKILWKDMNNNTYKEENIN